MKSLIISIFIILFAYAQVHAQGWNFGAEAGYVRSVIDTESYKTDGKIGYALALTAGYDFKCDVTLETGLSYIVKGGTVKGLDSNSTVNGHKFHEIDFSTMGYIQLPVRVGYKFSGGHGLQLEPQIGGFFAAGIGGHSFITGTNDYGQPYTSRVSTFSAAKYPPFRACDRFDTGLSASLKLVYRHVGLRLSYDYSLLTSTFYGSGKLRTVSVSAIYLLK